MTAFSTKSLLQLHFPNFLQGCLWLTVSFDFLVCVCVPPALGLGDKTLTNPWKHPPSIPVDSSSRILLAHPFYGCVDPQVLVDGEVRPERVVLRAVPQEGGRVVLEVGRCSISTLQQHLRNQGGRFALTLSCPGARVWFRGRLRAWLGFRWGKPKSEGVILQPSFTWFLNINMAKWGRCNCLSKLEVAHDIFY